MGKTKGTKTDASPLNELKDLYRFMVEQKLETLEYDRDGVRMRLVRQRPATVQVPAPVYVPVGGAPGGIGPSGPAPGAAGGGTVPAGVAGLPPGAVTIKSPMMGIFYRGSSPSSPPFVKRGDAVKRGQVLCLVEAMKVFNEIKADFDCAIEVVLLENGKPIKSGQDLYVVTRK